MTMNIAMTMTMTTTPTATIFFLITSNEIWMRDMTIPGDIVLCACMRANNRYQDTHNIINKMDPTFIYRFKSRHILHRRRRWYGLYITILSQYSIRQMQLDGMSILEKTPNKGNRLKGPTNSMSIVGTPDHIRDGQSI